MGKRGIGIPSASSVASDISVLLLGSETLKNEVSGQKWGKVDKSEHKLQGAPPLRKIDIFYVSS